MKRIFNYAFFLSLLCACAHVQGTITTCDVLPMTKSAELKSTRFAFDGDVALSITAGDEDTRILTGFITESPLKVAQEGKKSLHLEVAPIKGITSPEGYRIEATTDKVAITAGSGAAEVCTGAAAGGGCPSVVCVRRPLCHGIGAH